MKSVVQHEKLGEIVYEETFWTGKKKVYLNRQELQKLDKKTFSDESGKQVTVKGNYLAGVSLAFESPETIEVQMTPRVKWYEIVLALLPFLFILVWGNVAALCEIVPVVGGAIGGGISGVMACLSLLCMKGVKNIWLKIAIGIGFFAVTFGICYGIALAILAAV